ncbi:MAG: hypothetical protein WB800_33015, partial [Streptosporangiaceae bacterium]
APPPQSLPMRSWWTGAGVSSRFVPFPDEPTQVTIVDHQPGWPSEFDRIAGQLREVLGRAAIAWP